MCNICNAIYGHLDSCPENETENRVVCLWCENKLKNGDIAVTFPNNQTYCKSCIEEFDLSDLLAVMNVRDCFELLERLNAFEIYELGGSNDY